MIFVIKTDLALEAPRFKNALGRRAELAKVGDFSANPENITIERPARGAEPHKTMHALPGSSNPENVTMEHCATRSTADRARGFTLQDGNPENITIAFEPTKSPLRSACGQHPENVTIKREEGGRPFFRAGLWITPGKRHTDPENVTANPENVTITPLKPLPCKAFSRLKR